jgi:hypothetical protein
VTRSECATLTLTGLAFMPAGPSPDKERAEFHISDVFSGCNLALHRFFRFTSDVSHAPVVATFHTRAAFQTCHFGTGGHFCFNCTSPTGNRGVFEMLLGTCGVTESYMDGLLRTILARYNEEKKKTVAEITDLLSRYAKWFDT